MRPESNITIGALQRKAYIREILANPTNISRQNIEAYKERSAEAVFRQTLIPSATSLRNKNFADPTAVQREIDRLDNLPKEKLMAEILEKTKQEAKRLKIPANA